MYHIHIYGQFYKVYINLYIFILTIYIYTDCFVKQAKSSIWNKTQGILCIEVLPLGKQDYIQEEEFAWYLAP